MNRQKDYSGGRTHFSQFPDSINPAQYWHRDISYNDIWLQAESFGHQGSAVTRGSNHVKVGRQQGRLRLQQMPMIIGQKYARAIQGCNSWGKHANVKMPDTAQAVNLTARLSSRSSAMGRFCGMRRQLRYWGNPQVLIHWHEPLHQGKPPRLCGPSVPKDFEYVYPQSFVLRTRAAGDPAFQKQMVLEHCVRSSGPPFPRRTDRGTREWPLTIT
jgi:hypothetical protein